MSDQPTVLSSLQGLDDFVAETMRLWKVPGAALAVVQGGQTVLARGYGLRDVAQALPVTPNTLFAIGSCTKAFTAMAVALLVEEGKLDWDKPLRDYLPTFALHDAVASERFTARDLLCHRSGLPRHDLMWYGSALSREQLFQRLRYLEPNKDFRQLWQYQNLMFMAAGYLVEQLAGCSWEEFVAARILSPLGMSATNFSVTVSQRAPDYALPYNEREEQVSSIPFRNLDAVGPAGSINSNVLDMTRWLRLHLGKGKIGDQPLISEGNLSQMHAPQMVVQGPLKYKELLHSSYGLGWSIQPYRGYLMVEHGGNIDGFSAAAAFMPQEDLGVVILCNMNGSPMPQIIGYNLFDRLLGLEPVPWNERLKTDFDAAKEAQKKGKEQSASRRQEGKGPSHPLEDYAGDYEHPAYGRLSVRLEDGVLTATRDALSFTVEHYHYDVFEIVLSAFDMRAKISFTTDVQGNIASLSAPLEPSVKEIVFTRVADRTLSDKATLERYAGVYELQGLRVIISLAGEDRLTLTVPGQPVQELVPYRGTTFHLAGVTGVSVEFIRDEQGAVTSAELNQGGALFTMKRLPA